MAMINSLDSPRDCQAPIVMGAEKRATNREGQSALRPAKTTGRRRYTYPYTLDLLPFGLYRRLRNLTGSWECAERI